METAADRNDARESLSAVLSLERFFRMVCWKLVRKNAKAEVTHRTTLARLKTTEIQILLYLLLYGDDCPMKDVGSALGLQNATVFLLPLAEGNARRPGMQLIEIDRSAHDLRAKRMRLTEKGKAIATVLHKEMELLLSDITSLKNLAREVATVAALEHTL